MGKNDGEQDKFIVKLIREVVDLNEDQIGEVECEQQLDLEEPEDSLDSKDSSRESNAQTSCSYDNYPILCSSFKDPDTQLDKVVLAVSLPRGVRRVMIDVSDEGMSAKVKYKWPKTLHHMDDLFASKLLEKDMHIYHPMISASNNMLENVRSRIDTSPESAITIPLPIKVQSTVESTVTWGINRVVGTKIVVAVFTGYVKIYSKKLLILM
ncbi:hypothetical protein Bhyg_07680 [Pseudolycoriella hygida]|uniref:Uncharacterized protein n=1 Tax=Pseudolycoriella hygida TaxID=35572 RepID=A0A9Q0N4F5_9DIPT|nr:hypothetical protein Bhyg_07680 [Pseudolycoriella hygida]